MLLEKIESLSEENLRDWWMWGELLFDKAEGEDFDAWLCDNSYSVPRIGRFCELSAEKMLSITLEYMQYKEYPLAMDYMEDYIANFNIRTDLVVKRAIFYGFYYIRDNY